jgi:hypothetical protein
MFLSWIYGNKNDDDECLLSIMYDILSQTNSTLLTADMSLLCTKVPVPNSWFSFLFYRKMCILSASSVPPPSHLTSCTPSKCNLYFDSSFDTVTSEHAYKFLTFQVPNLVSIFRHLGRLSKEFIEVQVYGKLSVTCLFFYGKGLLAPRPTPQAGGPPLVVCLWILIHCIHSIAGGCPSIRNPKTHHVVVTTDSPNMECFLTFSLLVCSLGNVIIRMWETVILSCRCVKLGLWH